MVDKARRKELVRDYNERKPSVGVFAVKCAANGAAWVGWSKSLDKRKNSLWFQLGAGGAAGASGLAAAWKQHGEASFSYEILEEIAEDNPHKLDMLLEERATHWRAQLNADALPSR